MIVGGKVCECDSEGHSMCVIVRGKVCECDSEGHSV